MSVVIELGFRYIWVDRYCIPQNDKKAKDRLIRYMGHIYKNSVLTLIAAAGDDPNYGLPGVHPRLQQRPNPVAVENWEYRCFSDDTRRPIAESKWNTRGWTYQGTSLNKYFVSMLLCLLLVDTSNETLPHNLPISLSYASRVVLIVLHFSSFLCSSTNTK